MHIHYTRPNNIPIFPPNVTILEPREIGKYNNNFTLHLHSRYLVFKIVTNKQYIIQLRRMFFGRSRSLRLPLGTNRYDSYAYQ